MRIGHLYRDYEGPGSVPYEVRSLTVNQASLGHNVIVYTYSRECTLEEKVLNGVTVRRFPLSTRWPFAIPEGIASVLRTNGDELDVLHLYSGYFPCNVGAVKAARTGGIPYVVSPHGALNPAIMMRGRLKKLLYKYWFELPILNNTIACHALSPTEEKQMRMYGVTTPVFIAPNGIDLHEVPLVNDKEFLQKHYGCADNNEYMLAYLGRLDVFQKGLDLLLEGFAWAVQQVPMLRATLALIGPDWKGGRSRLERLATRLGIQDFAIFAGPIYGLDKFRALSSCDIYVHPSRWEGMPRAVREALAMGCPVIVTRETNTGELVQSYDAGLVVDLDSKSIGRAIIELLRDEASRKRKEERARSLVKDISWRHVAELVCNGYQSHLDMR